MATQARSGELTRQAGAAWDRLLWGLGDLRRLLLARGLWLAPATTLAGSDGRLWRADGARAQPLQAGRAAGVLMATDACLWGTLHLPQVSRTLLDDAVQEALWRESPLPLDDVRCAWSLRPATGGLDGWLADWGLCPDHAVQAALRGAGLGDEAPVLLLRADGRVLAARGATHARMVRRQRRSSLLAGALLLFAAASVALPALMPLALKRHAVIGAMQHEAAATQQAAPLRDRLDALRQDSDTLDQLRAHADSSLPLASVVEQLATALPDDTWLNRLEASNRQVRLSGLTSNATDLLSRLARNHAFADVRATAPTVRDEGGAKDRFSFELRWVGERGEDGGGS